MNVAEVLEIAKAEGVSLALDGERLTWTADHQPPAALLAEIKAHRLGIIEALRPANDSPEVLAWLERVARLLGCAPAYLLERGFVDRHDLTEQHQQHPRFAACLIRSHPDWCQPSEHSARAREGVTPEVSKSLVNRRVTTETAEFWEQYARVREEANESQPAQHTAATASPAWIAARDDFHAHALGLCPNCYPSLGRYCGIGSELRASYMAAYWLHFQDQASAQQFIQAGTT